MSEPSHDLVLIASFGSSDEQQVVRWCQSCGAVVVDMDYDGRTAAGYYMKMCVPHMTAETHCRNPEALAEARGKK